MSLPSFHRQRLPYTRRSAFLVFTLCLFSGVSELRAADQSGTNQDYSEPIGYQPLRRVIRAGIRVAF